MRAGAAAAGKRIIENSSTGERFPIRLSASFSSSSAIVTDGLRKGCIFYHFFPQKPIFPPSPNLAIHLRAVYIAPEAVWSKLYPHAFWIDPFTIMLKENTKWIMQILSSRRTQVWQQMITGTAECAFYVFPRQREERFVEVQIAQVAVWVRGSRP